MISDSRKYGIIRHGVVAAYDKDAMSAVIQPDGPGGLIKDVICLFTRYDPNTNAFSFRPPTARAPCIYTEIDGTYYLLGVHAPLNYTNTEFKSEFGNIDNYTPPTFQHHIITPGSVVDTNGNGAEESFTETMKTIEMVKDKLYSVWNLLNQIWENACLIFRLYSGPLDVTAEVTEEKECNTTVKVRSTLSEKEEGQQTTIDIRAGKDADIFQININGAPLIHVDKDRNVQIVAKQIDVSATEKINYTAKEINTSAQEKISYDTKEINTSASEKLNYDTKEIKTSASEKISYETKNLQTEASDKINFKSKDASFMDCDKVELP